MSYLVLALSEKLLLTMLMSKKVEQKFKLSHNIEIGVDCREGLLPQGLLAEDLEGWVPMGLEQTQYTKGQYTGPGPEGCQCHRRQMKARRLEGQMRPRRPRRPLRDLIAGFSVLLMGMLGVEKGATYSAMA